MDLSGITFLDLHSARELVLRYQLHADHLTLSNPSSWVSASIEAFGLAAWIHFHPTSDHEEPPLVSEASLNTDSGGQQVGDEKRRTRSKAEPNGTPTQYLRGTCAPVPTAQLLR